MIGSPQASVDLSEEEQNQEHSAERDEGRRGGPPPVDVQGLSNCDGCDEGAVGYGEEGAEGDPEYEAYPGGVAQRAEGRAEASARGGTFEDDEDKDSKPGDQKRREYEGDDEPQKGCVDESVVELP
jgi:hypothetical protein